MLEYFITIIDAYYLLVYLLIFMFTRFPILLLVVGMLTHYTVLRFDLVLLLSIMGAYIHNEFLFFCIRQFKFLRRVARLVDRKSYAHIENSFTNCSVANYMFFHRYILDSVVCGITPVALSTIAWYRFAILNLASVSLWTIFWSVLGFLSAKIVILLFNDQWLLLNLLIVFSLALLSHIVWRVLK